MRKGDWENLTDAESLKLNFTKEEIGEVVWNLSLDKSLGPDGFPLLFF